MSTEPGREQNWYPYIPHMVAIELQRLLNVVDLASLRPATMQHVRKTGVPDQQARLVHQPYP